MPPQHPQCLVDDGHDNVFEFFVELFHRQWHSKHSAIEGFVTKTGLNEQLLQKLAKLARLALDDHELRGLLPELSSIVRHVDALRAVPTAGVRPMTHGAPLPTGDATTTTTTMATTTESTPEPVLGRRAIEQSAGYDVDDGMVKVPRVVD